MIIYTRILLIAVAVRKLQVAIIATCRLWEDRAGAGRCLKLFVSTDSTSSHEFASQFGRGIFLNAKNTQKLAETVSHSRVFIWMKQPLIARDTSKTER